MAVGGAPSYRPRLPCRARVDRRAYRRRNADSVPADDSPAGKGIAAEPIDDGAFDRPVELSKIRSGNGARGAGAAPERAAGDLLSAGSFQRGQETVESRLVLLQLAEPAFGAASRPLEALELHGPF